MDPFSVSVVKTPFQVAGFYVKAFNSLSCYHYVKLYSLTTTYKVSISYSSSTAEEIALILEAMSNGIFCRFLDMKIFVVFQANSIFRQKALNSRFCPLEIFESDKYF